MTRVPLAVSSNHEGEGWSIWCRTDLSEFHSAPDTSVKKTDLAWFYCALIYYIYILPECEQSLRNREQGQATLTIIFMNSNCIYEIVFGSNLKLAFLLSQNGENNMIKQF